MLRFPEVYYSKLYKYCYSKLIVLKKMLLNVDIKLSTTNNFHAFLKVNSQACHYQTADKIKVLSLKI